MKTLLCPSCGCDIEHHYQWCYTCSKCHFSYIDARIASQRAEAIEYLKGLAVFVRIEIETTGEPMSDDWEKLLAAVGAYRAIGVLNSPKENRHA